MTTYFKFALTHLQANVTYLIIIIIWQVNVKHITVKMLISFTMACYMLHGGRHAAMQI